MNIFDTASLAVGTPLNPDMISFGTDGIRGCVKTALTPSLAMQIGYWFGQVLLHEGPVLIGLDSRNSSPMLSAALSAGLNASGHEVWNLGLCPTPAVPNLIRRFSAVGGLMVSGSHNPPQDNGIKLFGTSGTKLSKTQQRAIEAALKGDHQANDICFSSAINHLYGCTYQRYDLLEFYRNSLLASVQNKRLDGVRIVLDLCWGSATFSGAELFQALGADVILLHSEPNGHRINKECGSTHLEPLQRAVRENNAEMGFSFDGDADRMLAIDSKGRIMNGDHILYLWGSALMEKGKLPDNRLVATIMSNLAFEKVWHDRGGLLERTSVGDQYVCETMQATGAALGGEQSGHILSVQNGMSGDGLLTALQVATLIHAEESTLSNWMDSSFISYPQKLTNVRVLDPKLRREWYKNDKLRKIIDEAEKSMNDQGRILLRPSGTEPVLRVMVEAIDYAMVNHWSTKIVSVIEMNLNI